MTRVGIIVGVLAIVCVYTPLALAYRTNADLPILEGNGPAVWPSRVVPFEAADDVLPGFSPDRSHRAIREGMAVWEEHDCSDLILILVPSNRPAISGDGVNTITWLREGLHDLGLPDGTVGFADVIYGTSFDGDAIIVEADIYFDASSVHWTDSAPTDGATNLLRIQTAVAHEIGHALGFLHPCEVDGQDGAPDCKDSVLFADDLLFPLYSANDEPALSEDESEGLCALYPKQICSSGCGHTERCLGGECYVTCGRFLCDQSQTCINDTCVRHTCDERAGPHALCTLCDDVSDCSDIGVCAGDICTKNIRRIMGDPCSDASDCRTQICIDSSCSSRCSSHKDCPKHYLCHGDICVSDHAMFGEPCTLGTQCVSSKCLYDRELSYGSCTRVCSNSSPCPASHECAVIAEEEERQICIPRETSGCSASTAPSGLLPILVIFLFTLLRRRLLLTTAKQACE